MRATVEPEEVGWLLVEVAELLKGNNSRLADNQTHAEDDDR